MDANSTTPVLDELALSSNLDDKNIALHLTKLSCPGGIGFKTSFVIDSFKQFYSFLKGVDQHLLENRPEEKSD